jgi:hypothetical protein
MDCTTINNQLQYFKYHILIILLLLHWNASAIFVKGMTNFTKQLQKKCIPSIKNKWWLSWDQKEIRQDRARKDNWDPEHKEKYGRQYKNWKHKFDTNKTFKERQILTKHSNNSHSTTNRDWKTEGIHQTLYTPYHSLNNQKLIEALIWSQNHCVQNQSHQHKHPKKFKICQQQKKNKKTWKST